MFGTQISNSSHYYYRPNTLLYSKSRSPNLPQQRLGKGLVDWWTLNAGLRKVDRVGKVVLRKVLQ